MYIVGSRRVSLGVVRVVRASEASWRPLGSLLGASWRPLGTLLARLEATSAPLRGLLGPLG